MVCFLRNIVATVNLDCRLDLKTIALHARNAEYNPKVLTNIAQAILHLAKLLLAFRCSDHAYPRTKDNRSHLRVWQDGSYRRKV